MALNWNIGAIADVEKLHNTGAGSFPKGSPEDMAGDDEWAITEKLIWMTMILGIPRITEKNVEKFTHRFFMYEKVCGTVLGKRDENKVLQPMVGSEQIRRRVGLSTNASSKTDAEFKKFMWEKLEEEARARVSLEEYRANRKEVSA